MSADPWGFTRVGRVDPPVRPISERVHDWAPVYGHLPLVDVQLQANRCMDCGVPFCHAGCPLGNVIPDWNELVSEGDWHAASDRLHATNNFPEFTGWLCPAPCEDACVLTGTGEDPVGIKNVERAIVEQAWERGWVEPKPPMARTGRRVAVVGSGPAGLAAAQQLTRAGHTVVVFERDDRVGGLLRYGIPDFKLDKRLIDRRLAQMTAEGTSFVVATTVGRHVSGPELRSTFDAVVLACGSTRARDVQIPGRHLSGVHQAMDYLPMANRAVRAHGRPPIDAFGRRVVIVGGGDTAADCLGTARRQGALSVTQLDHNPAPPDLRDPVGNPWPQVARVHPHAPVYEEGLTEQWATEIDEFESDGDRAPAAGGRVTAVRGHEVRVARLGEGRTFERTSADFRIPADLVLLAAGFEGPERGAWLEDLGVRRAGSGAIDVADDWSTGQPGVWACGDATKGASLVVWAIAQGRSCAAAVNDALGGEVGVPAPVTPQSAPL